MSTLWRSEEDRRIMAVMSNATCLYKNCTDNDNDFDDEDYAAGFTPEVDIVGIVLALAIIFINAWVFVLVGRKPSLRTRENVILTSLAASDLLTGLVSLPLSVTCNIFQKHGVCFATIFVWMFTSFLAVSHILAVTTDRFIAIIYSLQYRTIVTKRRCNIALGVVWLSSLVLSLIQFWWLDPTSYDPQAALSEDVRRNEHVYAITCLVVYVGIPLGFMAFAYARIIHEVRRQNKLELINTPADLKERRRWRQREGRTVSIFVFMFLTYLICWLPYFLLRYQQALNAFPLPHWAEYTIGYVRFASSFLNPCLYILGKRDFRKATRTAHKRKERTLTCSEV